MKKVRKTLLCMIFALMLISCVNISSEAAYERDGETYLQVGDIWESQHHLLYKITSIGYMGKSLNNSDVCGTAKFIGRAPGNTDPNIVTEGYLPHGVYLDGFEGQKSVAITEIESGALKNDKYLEYISCGGFCETLPKDFCKGCKKLKSVTITTFSKTKKIETGAFSKCPNLVSVYLSNNLNSISKKSFKGSAKKSKNLYIVVQKSKAKKMKKLLKGNDLMKKKNKDYHISPDSKDYKSYEII